MVKETMTMVTILNENKVTVLQGAAGSALWVSPDEMTAATGWALKTEGLCKDEVCVPVPANKSERLIADGRVNVSEVWKLMGKPAAVSNDGDVWSLGEAAKDRNEAMLSLEAPDFSLPDFNGKLHSLTDFRRKRVLLITWASW
jgi:hypothetical protein